MTSRATKKKARATRSGRQRFSTGLPHARLVEIFDELKSTLEPRLSWRTRTDLLLVLFKILDQGRDTRVKTLPWQIAMLAAALVDKPRGAQPKAAIIEAIEFYAPERAADAKFRAYIERTYSRLRGGENPARSQLLPVSSEVVEMASRHINAHVSVKGQAR